VTGAAAHAVTSAPRRGATPRIESIDLLRGLVMVLMALDHSRDFFGDFAARPTDLATTTAALFCTRWVTHLCAPTFFLLTGTGAYLARARLSAPQLSRFLLARGAWLLVLELVVMRFALQFNLDYQLTIITVLWALGWSMIVLAGVSRLPLWGIAAFGMALVAGHNALDGLAPGMAADPGPLGRLWIVLHQPGTLFHGSHALVHVSYVLIPWVGVTALGYVLGAIYEWSAVRRRKLLLHLGIGLIAAFVVLRFSNLYGDPALWSRQSSAAWTVMSFINTTKYPPSLLFLLMTLGPALLLLRAFDGGVPAWLKPLATLGKVPLFFYVLHIFLIHLLAVVASYVRYGEVSEVFRSPDLGHFPFSAPPDWNLGLPFVYLVWVVVVIALYPLCRWYAGLRQRRRAWWLSYL
jgi:uncharacterized membrane protein